MSHIAIFLRDLRGGGAERVMLELAGAFRSEGVRVTFVLRQAQGDLIGEARAGFDVVELQAERVRYAYGPLRRWILSARPDLMLANLWPTAALAVFAARGTGTRVVAVEHSVLSRQYAGWGIATNFKLRRTIRHIYPMAHGIVGVSAGVARDIEALGGLRPGSVRVIHNPVRSPVQVAGAEIAAAAEAWGPREGPRLLAVGSLKAVKNQALLLDAFGQLQRVAPSRLLILGEGVLRPQLKEQVRALGLEGRVRLPGFRSALAPFYSAADLFVLSSDYEGFGNVIVEAMSYGVPVVSTDCPSGPAEILDGGRFGRLVPVGDASALAAAMAEALNAPRNPAPLIARAAEFTPERAAAQYLALLS